MGNNKKQQIITFKVDEPLAEAMQQVPNKSEFIRQAIMEALDKQCPLCQGAGVLTSAQQEHWDRFISKHSLEKCRQCQAVHLVCNADDTCSLH